MLSTALAYSEICEGMGRACGKGFHISGGEEAFTWWIFFFKIMVPASDFAR